MTDSEFKYWAFLGLSQLDNREQRPDGPGTGRLCWGNQLQEALKGFSIPAEFAGQINARGERVPERIHPIFQDESEPAGDAGLSADVRQALAQSRCLVVICSPRSARDGHVNEAVRYFKQLGRGQRILPVVIAGVPNAGDGSRPDVSPDDECFVPALRHPVQPDGTLDTSRPAGKFIFVDARHGTDKREILAHDHRQAEADLEIAKTQLVALVIGVGFNGLWWREQQRHFFDLAEARNRLREAQAQARDAQSKALEFQNLPHDVHRQIQEAQTKAQAAESQARDTQTQIAEARSRVLAVEGQLVAAQNQAQAAQRLAAETQVQLQAAKTQAQAVSGENLETQHHVAEARRQVQALQSQTGQAQTQVQEARNQAEAAQGKVQVAQRQAQEAEARASEAQQQLLAFQNKFNETQSQLAEARDGVLAAENKLREAQHQAGESQRQAAEARRQVHEVQSQSQQVLTRIQETQNQAGEAQGQVEVFQNQIRQTRRLATMLALVALMALLVASVVWWQRKATVQTPARPAADATNEADLAQGALDQEQIQHALQKLGATPPDENRDLDALAARIPAEMIPETLASSVTNLAEPQRGDFQLDVLGNWMKTDLSGAREWVRQLPDADFRNRALEKIIPLLAADNLTNTLALLNDLQPAPGETNYTQLFQYWATNDPAQAIEQRQQVPGRDADDKILNVILSAWVANDAASAAGYVKNLSPGDFRQTAMAGLCEYWTNALAGTNTPAILAWAQSLPAENERVAVTNQAVVNWAQNDPQAARQFAVQHPELPADVLGEIAVASAQTDLTATTNWVASLTDDTKKNTVLLALADVWAQTDPKGLATYALGLPAGDVQTQFLTAACRQLAVADLPGAVELLKPLADDALRQQLLEQAARRCDLSHINAAAKYAATLPAGDDQQAVIKGLLSTWTPVDPETAANWLGSFPATNAQPGQVQSVIKSWAQTEPAAAANWLTNLPAGTNREETLDAFVAGAATKYPGFAAQWTASVTNEIQRQKYQLQVAQQWLKTDAAAATNWLDRLKLQTNASN